MLHTNKKHRFLTVEKGFVPMGQIKLGMHVVEADGQVGVVSGWKLVPGVKTMYNLEVAQDHTYTVGAGQWVVHNCGGSDYNENLLNDRLQPQDSESQLTTQHDNVQSAFQKVQESLDRLGGAPGENDMRTQVKLGPEEYQGIDNGLVEGPRGWRLDFDPNPEKGLHFNFYDWTAKGSLGRWGAATFPGGIGDYEDLLLKFAVGGVESMLSD